MDPRKMIIATSFFSTLIILAATMSVAYFGYQTFDQRIKTEQENLASAILDLKAEALEEIKAIANNTTSEAPETPNQELSTINNTLSALNSGMSELQMTVGEMKKEQEKLAELMQLRTDGMMTAAPTPPPALARPGTREDTLNQTVYFSLGKFDGVEPIRQINALIPKLLEYAGSGNCKSNVMGFSDTLGGDKSNLRLSLQRAGYVASLLRKAQIPVGEVKGWGERWLDIHTVDGVKNDKNRRVVIETACRDHQTVTTQPIS